MSRFLPLLTKMAAAVLLIGSMNMNVWAEKAISDSLPGVEYDSVADLENCIKNHKGEKKTSRYSLYFFDGKIVYSSVCGRGEIRNQLD